MWALTTSSEVIRPDLMAFAIQVADAPITFLRRRFLLGISDDDLDVQRHARVLPDLRTRGRGDLKTEKAILPQRQYEDRDGGDSPQVREGQVARLAVKPEEADAEQRKGQHSPPFDRANRDHEDQRQERQPLVRPDV